METIVLFILANIGAFIAGYAIASENATREKQAIQDNNFQLLRRYREQLAELRKQTACACGLAHNHTGKHAPQSKSKK